MVTPELKFGWPITIIRRQVSKNFRFLIQLCSLCATKPKKKLDWKRSSTPHLTSFHEMRWRELSKKVWKHWKNFPTFAYLKSRWSAATAIQTISTATTNFYIRVCTLLNLPKGKSIFNQLKMVLVSSNTCCCWVNTERKINFKKRQISDPYFKTVLWWVPTYLLA